MPTELRPLTDDEIVAIVESEQASAEAWGEELSGERETALDYYYARPLGDEEEGSSQVVSNDVCEVVEWMMPILVRMFCADDELIEFIPSGNDIAGASAATKYVRHVVFTENDGFRLIHDTIKDGILSKVGAFKWGWVEKREPIDRDYRGLSELELVQLMDGLRNPGVEVQIIGQQVNQQPDGSVTFDVRVRMIRQWGQVEIDAIPPEELLVTRSCKVINDTTRYVGHRTVKSRSELVQMGIPIERVLELPTYTGSWFNAETASRFATSGGSIDVPAGNTMAEPVEYIEHYVLLDADADGIAERRLICTAGGELLRNEMIGCLPVSAWSPVRMSHAVIGRSIADLTTDIQRIMTALLRGTLNNIYNVNSGGRLFVKGNVNLDDLLTSRPGGIVRGKDDSSVTPLANEYIGDRAMQVMQMVRQMRDERSGVVKHGQGLNAADLHDSATVGNRMLEQALERIELIGRLYAEFALKPLWHGVLDHVIRYQDSKKQVRVAGSVIEVDPLAFREKYNLRVKVGIGTATKDRRLAWLSKTAEYQSAAMQAGIPMVGPQQIYNTAADMAELAGMDASRYWIDPSSPEGQKMAAQKAQAAQQREPNPLVEAEMVKSKARMAEADQQNKFDRADRMLDHAEKMTELELKYMTDVPGSSV